MTVNSRLRAMTALLPLFGLIASCGEDERVQVPCSLAASIFFDGREYIAVDSLPGLTRREVRVGERLGTGELATCPGQPVRKVQVYKVVGVPVVQAVFSKPKFGLMERWNQDPIE